MRDWGQDEEEVTSGVNNLKKPHVVRLVLFQLKRVYRLRVNYTYEPFGECLVDGHYKPS